MRAALLAAALCALSGCGDRLEVSRAAADRSASEGAGLFGFMGRLSPAAAEAPGLLGIPGLVGQPTSVEGPGRCGAAEAVEITSVAGVALSRPARMRPAVAVALDRWVRDGLQPAFGGQVVEMRVAADYACRGRNNVKGAKLSEHGFANAIDLSAFTLADGRVVTVQDGWRVRETSGALKAAWQAACGPFGTVLGPNSDAHHRDHFHFDSASYRSGSYCR